MNTLDEDKQQRFRVAVSIYARLVAVTVLLALVYGAAKSRTLAATLWCSGMSVVILGIGLLFYLIDKT